MTTRYNIRAEAEAEADRLSSEELTLDVFPTCDGDYLLVERRPLIPTTMRNAPPMTMRSSQ